MKKLAVLLAIPILMLSVTPQAFGECNKITFKNETNQGHTLFVMLFCNLGAFSNSNEQDRREINLLANSELIININEPLCCKIGGLAINGHIAELNQSQTIDGMCVTVDDCEVIIRPDPCF